MAISTEKKQLIIQLHRRGFKNKFIAQNLNCTEKTIRKFIKQWKNGIFPMPPKRRNREYILSAQQIFRVLKHFIDNPFSTYEQCIKKLKLPVGRVTIFRLLKRDGIRNNVACSKQFISMQNQIKRLKFALKYKHWTTEWLQVNFMDEKTVQTYADGRVMVKRRVHERFDHDKLLAQEVQNTKNKINLFGTVSFSGRNVIYSVSTKFNGSEFENLTRTKLMDIIGSSTVLIDNASIHSKGIEYLKNRGVRVLDFPPKSNDMNIIENVWGEVQKILNIKLRGITISTKDQLLDLIGQSWKAIPESFIENCILSMPNRLKAVIQAKGKQTKY